MLCNQQKVGVKDILAHRASTPWPHYNCNVSSSFQVACSFLGRIISSVQSLSCVQLFATPWTTACQASLSITNSQSLFKLTSIESVMPSSHLILCRPLLLLPSIFPSIRVFSNESILQIRWPKYWSFSFSISFSFNPSNEYSGLISLWIDVLGKLMMLKLKLQYFGHLM